MICYRDRTYCDTDKNQCKNIECNKHLKNEGEYSLKFNEGELPIATSDFSKSCDEFEMITDT